MIKGKMLNAILLKGTFGLVNDEFNNLSKERREKAIDIIEHYNLNSEIGIEDFTSSKSLNEVLEIIFDIFPEFEAKEGD